MKKSIPAWVRIPTILFIIFGVIEFFIDSGEKPAFIEYPIILLFLVLVLLILVAIEAIGNILEDILFKKLDDDAKAIYLADKEKSYEFTWLKNTYKKLLGQKPLEEEGEIILDHNYDGIKELDNNLPPWWLYGFYISIIFAAVYLLKYHVFNGDNQIDELETELAEAKTAIEAYKKTAKNLVDINTVTQLTDAADLNAGKAIFETTCVACHMADGGGGIGPNLTDPNWILGGGIKNIFKTVSEGGRSGKGMIAWKQQLKPLQIAQVASYVLTLQGTTPANPKAPEGDVWVDVNAEVTTETVNEITIDSTQTTKLN